ncbi:MAG: ATP-dependent Clp protease proteolytic subunit [Patescibacteria group bacterium]
MSYVPMVIKRSYEGERAMDLYSRLLDDRIVMLTEDFNDVMASIIVAQLLYLDSIDNSKPIKMYINSPGGVITSMWSIIDTMNTIKSEVHTICIGMAASAASLTLAAGQKGHRSILEHAKVMIHQPLGGAQGQATDMEISVNEILKTKDILIDFLAEKTGKEKVKVKDDMERDYWLDAKQALDYGLVDKIIK